jgi:hypothetical protein
VSNKQAKQKDYRGAQYVHVYILINKDSVIESAPAAQDKKRIPTQIETTQMSIYVFLRRLLFVSTWREEVGRCDLFKQ